MRGALKIVRGIELGETAKMAIVINENECIREWS